MGRKIVKGGLEAGLESSIAKGMYKKRGKIDLGYKRNELGATNHHHHPNSAGEEEEEIRRRIPKGRE